MAYTEIIHESWWSRIKNSFGNILLGFILFLVAFPLLFWNEGRAVYRAQTLEEGISIITSINANRIDRENEGKLVHLSGRTESDETLVDTRFGLAQDNIIKLQRVVKIYQWQENQYSKTEEKIGGSAETTVTYTYNKIWASELYDSNKFKQPKGHENPSSMPFNSGIFQAKKVTLGAFKLPQNIINQLDNYQKLPLTDATFELVPEPLRDKLQVYNESYYMGENPTEPQIGDLQINFAIVLPDVISIIAKQTNATFAPYTTQIGGKIELFEYGAVTAEDMFRHEQEFNVMLTWVLRFVGFMIMFIGLNLIFGVLRTLAAVLPFLANIVGFIGGLVNFIMAAVLSIITIAIAWIVYRPLLGIALLIVAASLVYFLKFAPKPQETIPVTKLVN